MHVCLTTRWTNTSEKIWRPTLCVYVFWTNLTVDVDQFDNCFRQVWQWFLVCVFDNYILCHPILSTLEFHMHVLKQVYIASSTMLSYWNFKVNMLPWWRDEHVDDVHAHTSVQNNNALSSWVRWALTRWVEVHKWPCKPDERHPLGTRSPTTSI